MREAPRHRVRRLIALFAACVRAEPVPPPPAAPAPAPVPAPVTAPAPPSPRANRPPEGFVDLAEIVPGLVIDARYHTADNFTGAPLPGYGVPAAWLRAAPAAALARVQRRLEAEGLGLLVYDAYRPLRGTLGMVAWAKRTGQVHLLDDGYVARRSGHNRGNTVDLTARTLATGEPLDMGTPWDTLSEASHTRNATGAALEHRLKLKAAMEAEGFRNYWKEWWHYTFVEDGERELPHRDVPYGCFEAPEGAWKAPAGWDAAGFAPASSWVLPAPLPGACR